MAQFIYNRLSELDDRLYRTLQQWIVSAGELDFNQIVPLPTHLSTEEPNRAMQALAVYLRSLPEAERLALTKQLSERYKSQGISAAQNYQDRVREILAYSDEALQQLDRQLTEIYRNLPLVQLAHVGVDLSQATAVKAGQRYAENIMQYGAMTALDWKMLHWGTRWGALMTRYDARQHVIYFKTAQTAPLPAMQALADRFNCGFLLTYTDEEVGSELDYQTVNFDGDRAKQVRFGD